MKRSKDINAQAPTVTADQPTKPEAELKQAVKEKAVADKKADGFSFFDVVRVVGGIILLSGGLSYLTTSGTSMTWGYNPWWTRAREWKSLIVRKPARSPHFSSVYHA